jgi:hypothetical protein
MVSCSSSWDDALAEAQAAETANAMRIARSFWFIEYLSMHSRMGGLKWDERRKAGLRTRELERGRSGRIAFPNPRGLSGI